MTQGAETRRIASELVGRIVREGAYTNVVLRSATSRLSSADRALVYSDVYGAIRNLIAIDGLIEDVAGRSVSDIDPELLDRLRVGVVELELQGTPPHAAVDSIVSTVEGRGPRGFVNAVLRKIARSDDGLPPARLPGWIRSILEEDRADVAGFEAASLTDAPPAIRLRPGAPHIGTEIAGIPGARNVDDMVQARDLVEQRLAVFADPASTAVSLAVGARPGDRVLDLAAAPGGKTSHLIDAMEGRGLLVAADSHPRRVTSAVRRLADPRIHWMVMDGTRPALRSGEFDRVLLDAPCTGLGTLRRRPEIMHRLRPRSVQDLAELQRRLLDSAMSLVRPGGRVVYAVCTVTAAETTGVVADRGGRPPPGLPGEDVGSGLLLGPHTTGTDGMFISVIET